MEGTALVPHKVAPTVNLVGLSGPVLTLVTSGAPGYIRIHEGVLCADARSLAFKEILQSNRKPAGGECPICTEIILPLIEPVEWCKKGCGQNLHVHFVAEWLKRAKVPTCACCRSAWEKEDPQPKTFEIKATCGDSKITSFQTATGVYVHYIYTGNMVLNEEILHGSDGDGGNREIYLFELLLFGDILRDRDFKTAILRLILGSPNPDAPLKLVQWVCKHVPVRNSVRKLLVELFIRIGDMSILGDCPPLFNAEVLEEPLQEDMKSLERDLEAFLGKYATDEATVGFKISPANPPRKETNARRPPRPFQSGGAVPPAPVPLTGMTFGSDENRVELPPRTIRTNERAPALSSRRVARPQSSSAERNRESRVRNIAETFYTSQLEHSNSRTPLPSAQRQPRRQPRRSLRRDPFEELFPLTAEHEDSELEADFERHIRMMQVSKLKAKNWRMSILRRG